MMRSGFICMFVDYSQLNILIQFYFQQLEIIDGHISLYMI